MMFDEELKLATDMGLSLQFFVLCKLNFYNVHKDFHYEIDEDNKVKKINDIINIIDDRTSLPFPNRYFSDEIFKINYELKRNNEYISYLLKRQRESSLWYIKEYLASAYDNEQSLLKRKKFLSNSKKGFKSKFPDIKDFKSIKIIRLLDLYGIKYINTGKDRQKILCPFHKENTPSCVIFDNRYYCFGCGERGDAVDFVKNYEKISTKEAVEKLSCLKY